MRTKSYTDLGFLRVAAACPVLYLGDPRRNAEEILTWAKKLEENQVAIAVFPELGITGYTVEDAFFSQSLSDRTIEALAWLKTESQTLSLFFWVGAPWLQPDGGLLNTAFLIGRGKIWGAVPKTFLTDSREYYESRWFQSGRGVQERVKHPQLGEFPVSTEVLFRVGHCTFGTEICEDLWAPIPPSLGAVTAGAEVIFNLSASNELAGKAAKRRRLIGAFSDRARCAYVYASSGAWESTKDTVFGGHCLISEFGELLSETEVLSLEGQVCTADLDLDRIRQERRRDSTFVRLSSTAWETVDLGELKPLPTTLRKFRKTPFLPSQGAQTRMLEVLNIQSTALARRLAVISRPRAVLGLSGGVDSAWAAIVAKHACEKIRGQGAEVFLLGLPGPGSSNETQDIARVLASYLEMPYERIPISPLVEEELRALKHPKDSHDVTFENVQARARMTLLFNRANQVGGLVLGTSDLSEVWLGWSTYLGDHAAHYGLNAGIPKTLVRELVRLYARTTENRSLKEVLDQIVGLPYSPELLPPGKKGEISQHTEAQIGPYLLQDFFLYHFLRFGYSAEKLAAIAEIAFREVSQDGPAFSREEIRKWLGVFFRRGFQNQFKRTMFPPGPKVGSVSLSPRADFRFPDECRPDSWLF